MKRQLSDEEFESILRTLITDASVDESMVDEVADSPALWWSVQREINKQKDRATSPWPPVSVLRRWLMFGVPTFAAVALVAGIFIFRGLPTTESASVLTETAPTTTMTPAPAVPTDSTTEISVVAAPAKAEAPRDKTTKAAVKTTERRGARAVTATAMEKAAIKTDFIALSYARNPESGQLVRVKVPSSMMVTLGLVASVEKPNDLVDAEVVVGDDGLTRAIRFIR
ncbi:MAG: hypothetical protein KA746_07315 [Pyrinomonadaceae bacterium]|nr:hypothetical protein [Pyrinomonadaceae bacterium]MBP6212499.1 hypothetical protein [Pyrinomonadaceae bacterium]